MSTQAGNEAGNPPVTTPVTVPDAVSGAVERVRAGLVSGSGWQGIDVKTLGRAELLSTHRDLARMKRELEGMLAYSSAEIARRSQREDGQEGLAKREGFGSPEQLIASISGGSTWDANKLIEVGGAMSREEDAAIEAANVSDDDDEGPSVPITPLTPQFTSVRDSVLSGKLSIDGANLITRMLTRIWDRHDALGLELADIDRVERMLINRAYGLSSNKFGIVVRNIEAQMDSGRHSLTEELQRQERYVKMYDDQAGMFVLNARLDAETAAPVRAVLDALVSNAMHKRDDKSQVAEDDRSVVQMRADALAGIARHCLGCESKDIPTGSTAVVVRLTLSDLQNGAGVADIDGGSQPICISTARRMAANGKIIPVVLGGQSEVLDLGRGTYPFSYAQRIALIERDGGCAFCGAPPSYTQAHHIRWWARDAGATDLSNGLLLCSTCHHRIHRDDWQIKIRDNRVWFIPPRAIDAQQEPRLGGRARFGAPEYLAA